MFDWIRTKFATNGGVAIAQRRALNAAGKLGSLNSRKATRAAAEKLEADATTTKAALDLMQTALKDKENTCRKELASARENVAKAQKKHNAVKDTTFQKITRLATVGRAGWASRTAAVNATQARQTSIAEARAQSLVDLATKRKALLKAEAEKREEEQKLLDEVLNKSNKAAASAEAVVLPTPLVNNKLQQQKNNAAAAKNNAAAKKPNTAANNTNKNKNTAKQNPAGQFLLTNGQGGGRRGTRKPRRR